MGINDLQLTPELIAALYPESLVAGNERKQARTAVKSAPPQAGPVYPFMGKNLRSVCFLVSSPADEFIPEEKLTFLLKILSACKLTLDDIALVNLARHAVQLPALREQFKPRLLFLWGALPVSLAELNALPDLAVSSLDDFLVVPVRTADVMETDSPQGLEAKQKLWSLLKKLFNL